MLVSIAIQMIPVVGDAYSAFTGIIGFDPIAGVRLTDAERAIAIGSALVVGGGLHLLSRMGDGVADASRLGRAGEAGAGSRATDRAVTPASGARLDWVDEGGNLRAGSGPGMPARAYNYQSTVPGGRSSTISGRSQAPQVTYTNSSGSRVTAKFDGIDDVVLVDRKVSIFTSRKTAALATRQSEGLTALGTTGRWEVPSEAEANRAIRFLDGLRITNIDVRVVPMP